MSLCAISVWQPNQSPGFCWHHQDWEEFVKAVAAEVGIGEANSHFLYKRGWFSSGEQGGMAQRGWGVLSLLLGWKKISEKCHLMVDVTGVVPRSHPWRSLFLQGHPREGM